MNAVDLAEIAFEKLPETNPYRAAGLEGASVARVMVEQGRFRQALLLFREVSSAFRNLETNNPELAQAMSAARGAR